MNKYEIALEKLKKCVEYAYIDTYAAELKALRELVEKSKWHNFQSEVPEEDGVYIIAYRNYKGDVVVSTDEYDCDYCCFNVDVIAWKEMPEYEEE